MDGVVYLNKKNKSKYLVLTHNLENKNLNTEKVNNSDNLISNKFLENTTIKEEQIDIDINTNITENLNFKEEQLSLLLDSFETSYSQKLYYDLIRDIEEKENLLYQNSLMSFKIKILKIKAFLKLLLEEYNNYLQDKNKNFHRLDEIIHKLKKEFPVVSLISNNEDSYEYEMTTQIYCKFLYLLSKINLKKENYLKSLGYIILGINMMKIFFIRKKISSDIKTYKIYCKLVLELINVLIGDKNYEMSFYYIRLLFQIIEKSVSIIYYNNRKNNRNLIPTVTLKKFLIFGGIGYIYAGCCLEQLDDQIQAFQAYRQAKLFFKKGSRSGFSFQNLKIININNGCSYLIDEVMKKLKLKFEKDKIEFLNWQKNFELQKKREIKLLLQKEKFMKLKFIANGIGGNPLKLEKLENKFNKKIFPSKIDDCLENIDDDITSLVFTYFNKNKDNSISSYNDKISFKTKKLMSRYEACNILMSKEFRKFIIKTKKLQFYNPETSKKSISIIQKYLNNKIKIHSKRKKLSNTQRKSKHLSDKFLISSKSERRINIKGKLLNLNKSPNSSIKERERIKDLKFHFNQKKMRSKNNPKLLYNQPYKINKRKNSKLGISPLSNSKMNRSKSYKNFRYKLNFNSLENDYEKKNLDKNIMTKGYLHKYFYYDKLSQKELKFQKQFLFLKHNNSIYSEKNSVEEKNGIIEKDDLANISLIISEKAKENAINKENLMVIELIKDSFGAKQNKMSLKMKSAMASVINKYISMKSSRSIKENSVNVGRIQQNNKRKLLYLDNSINSIDYSISNIKKLLK